VGNILDMVFLIKNDENLILVGPPPSLSKINFPINYFGGGGGVPHFGYPGQQGKADVIPEPGIGAGRAPRRESWPI
jgi:hypothetical protein